MVVRLDDPVALRKAQADARFYFIVDNLSRGLGEFVKAIEERDWEALGFESIEAWRNALFGKLNRKLDASIRKEVVRMLTATGKTVREIAAATGAGVATISRDQKEAITETAGGLGSVPDGTRQASEAGEAATSARQEAARRREAQKAEREEQKRQKAEQEAEERAARVKRDSHMRGILRGLEGMSAYGPEEFFIWAQTEYLNYSGTQKDVHTWVRTAEHWIRLAGQLIRPEVPEEVAVTLQNEDEDENWQK